MSIPPKKPSRPFSRDGKKPFGKPSHGKPKFGKPSFPGRDYVKPEGEPAATLLGDDVTAIAAYQDLHIHDPGNSDAPFHAGLAEERRGQLARAGEHYRRGARATSSHRTDDASELARRALLRLQQPATRFASGADQVADHLVTALERRDVPALQRTISPTHFAAGPVGGHTRFEEPDLLEHLYRDLATSQVTARRPLLGTGGKRYLQTRGWNGRWFTGDVIFLIGRAPRGLMSTPSHACIPTRSARR